MKLASNVLWQQEANYLDLLTKIYNEVSYPASYELGHKKKQIFIPIMQQMALRGGSNHINKTVKTVDQRIKYWRAGYITDLFFDAVQTERRRATAFLQRRKEHQQKAQQHYQQQQFHCPIELQREEKQSSQEQIHDDNELSHTSLSPDRPQPPHHQSPVFKPPVSKKTIKYAVKYAREGYLAKASKTLDSQGLADWTPQNRALFRSKLPPGSPVPHRHVLLSQMMLWKKLLPKLILDLVVVLIVFVMVFFCNYGIMKLVNLLNVHTLNIYMPLLMDYYHLI